MEAEVITNGIITVSVFLRVFNSILRRAKVGPPM